tara:strand:+ start:1241 stop:1975 length:735 start_codon:yes stop_codon:yes gene_type:complete
MLGFMVKSLGHGLIDTVTRAAPRPLRAMAYVREHARAGDSEDALAKLDQFATEVRWLMSIGPNKDKVIAEAKDKLGEDVRILELGAYAGYSAIYMAKVFGAGCRLLSVEINPDCVEAVRGTVEHAGLGDRVEVVEGKSSDVIGELEGTFDLVFLDHWKDLYLDDLKLIESRGLLRDGSVVVADNVGEIFGAEKYLDYVRHCGHYESENRVATIEYTSVPDAVEISVYRDERSGSAGSEASTSSA